MSMKLYVGVTDKQWFDFLSRIQPDEVNFWRPRGDRSFHALQPGEPFLFKLHAPNHFIAGGGFYVGFSGLPLSIAWEAFQEKNGADSFRAFQQLIWNHRKSQGLFDPDPAIGCIVLTQPFFFDRSDWIPAPEDWRSGIMQGKGYGSGDPIGSRIWSQVEERLAAGAAGVGHTEFAFAEERGRYGPEATIRPRLGQGAFRVVVTDAYGRRCAISGEKTLPALDAAHIKPYEREGPHQLDNGLLLRADLHKLFDRGLVTVTPDLRVEVSKRIKEEWENGRDYYKFHGSPLSQIPTRPTDRPSQAFLQWHNENCYRG